MRFMIIHKATPETEAGTKPTPELIQRVGAMVGEMRDAGILRDGAGLRGSLFGVRLTFAGGRRMVQEGPFTGGNEDTAAFVVLRTRTREEAVEHATSFAAVLGDGE